MGLELQGREFGSGKRAFSGAFRSDSGQIPRETGEIRELDFNVQAGHLELTLGDDFALNSDGCDGVLVDSTRENGVWKLKVWSEYNHSQNHGSDDTVEVVLPRDAWYDAVELSAAPEPSPARSWPAAIWKWMYRRAAYSCAGCRPIPWT